MAQRFRNACITLNNPTDGTFEKIRELCTHGHEKMSYIVYGCETGAEGTPHLQMYIEFTTKISPRQFEKIMGQHAHFEERQGSPEQASGYCRKGTFQKNEGEDFDYATFHPEGKHYHDWIGMRWGNLKAPGKRPDFEKQCKRVENGEVSAEEIALELPQFYHQYGRTLHKIEDIMMRKKFRTQMTKGIWYHGLTAVGKSHRAFEGYNPDTHYVWKNSVWQDGYCGQPIVIINDFRGHIPYNELLQMVDKWPHFVERRGREPAPFLAETVIVTSSLTPEEVYNRRAVEDNIEQLLRRFEVIELAQRCPDG